MQTARKLLVVASWAWVLVILGGCAQLSAVKDYPFFLRQLVDLDRLAVLDEGSQCKQFSSYDRASKYDQATGKYLNWDANGDCGQYVRTDPQTGEGVMAEIDGPGCIHRIWSANPQGKIRFYFDGATTPSCEFDFNELFSGNVAGFPRPLVWQRRVVLGGDNPASDCYVPIPFAKSCRVTADKPHNQYYHIGYTTFPRDDKVTTFRRDLTAAQQVELQRVCHILSQHGADPQPVQGARAIDRTVTLNPGDKAVQELRGPATIRQFCAKLKSDERWARRKIVLQIYFDGESKPSVDSPLGDFFGDAWEEATYESLPLGITGPLNYCYWRMPFARSARIVLANEGRRPAEVHSRIVYKPGPLAAQTARFHAKWRRDRSSKEFDYPMLTCQGKGRFVGVVLFPDNIVGGWWGEGDEKVYVDGETFPSTFGTGSEDYFGDAWGIRYFVNPYHGCATNASFEATRRQSVYRWHIADSIPFDKSFTITIENYAAKGQGPIRNDYSSVAYWYQMPGGSDFFQTTPVAERIPQGPVVPGAIGAVSCLPAGSRKVQGAAVVSDDDLPEQLAHGKGLKIAGKAQDKVTLAIPAPDDGSYTIETVLAKGVKASSFDLLKDGKPIGDRVRLAKGTNAIDVQLKGEPVQGDRCEIVLDFFILHPWRNFVRGWYLIGPFDNTNWTGLERAYGPETEPFQVAKRYPGKGGDVAWQKITEPKGIVNCAKYFKENKNAVAYAYCEIVAPDECKTTAYVGSDDGVKVWLNGKQVHANPAKRPFTADQDKFEVSLAKGKNTLLLKVDQGEGEWAFSARLHDPQDKLEYTP